MALARTRWAMQEYRPLEGMQATAKEKERVTIPASGDELFEGGSVLFGKPGGLAGPHLFGGGISGPGIGDADIPEAMPDRPFQIFPASFTEPAEKEFVGKDDLECLVSGKGEGKGREPRLRLFLIKACLEPVFYLHGVGHKGRFLPGREGEHTPFVGVGKDVSVCLHERASGAGNSNIGAHAPY